VGLIDERDSSRGVELFDVVGDEVSPSARLAWLCITSTGSHSERKPGGCSQRRRILPSLAIRFLAER
jgi:hypothetical protein